MANQEHLDILKKGVGDWNKWREENPDVKPDLSNVVIYEEKGKICVTKINSDKNYSILLTELMNSYRGANLSNINLRETNLNKSVLIRANLKKADLRNAKFNEADLFNACLIESELSGADLQGIKLNNAELQGTALAYVNFQKAILSYAKFQKSWLIQINLQEAILLSAELQGAEILSSNLQGANFSYAMVDGETWIDETTKVDRSTYFEGVGLDAVRIDPGIKQLLEYNVRRKKWEGWYNNHPIQKWPVRLFWWISDYGISAPRIIKVFLFSAIAFALVYYLWGIISPPGIVDNLFVDGSGVKIAWWLVPLRAVHFSVVIMTVGFTNMYANPHSFWAHILVGFQMIWGFVLLGALVTRFAVLFTAGGPAGKFAGEKGEKEAKKSH